MTAYENASQKKPWRKGKISRVSNALSLSHDTAPLREEKREVNDHLMLRGHDL
jgi:hypothetical protein